MDNYLSIFDGILSTRGTFLDAYLDGLDEHRKFCMENNGDIGLVHHINSLMSKAPTRVLGFRVLDRIIDTCPINVLEEKGDLWATLVLKACNNSEPQCDDFFIFQLLNKIIKTSSRVPALTNSFISTHIVKIYEILTNLPNFKLKYALNCVETCLRWYPSSSGPSRGVIERNLWKNIDHIDYEVVKNCGKCLHLLQQVKGGGSGVQGISQKTQWKNYQLQLLGGIHSLYNEMFKNCIETYEEKIEQENLPWVTDVIRFDPEPVTKTAQMYTRCRNLITYLIIALTEPFPVEKPILIKKVLNVITRGLNVNCLMLGRNPIADNIALGILLPKLHISLLNLLNVTITILRGHLRPYSELISDLLINSLKWTTTKNAHGDRNTLLSLRKKAYDTLSYWCKIFYGGNHCETIAEQLFQEIVSDIVPASTELTLKISNGARKHMSKKVKRQIHSAQSDNSNMAKRKSADRNKKGENHSKKMNQDLCISALRCLQGIIFSIGNIVKPSVLKKMQTEVIQIAAIFYELPHQPEHLYSNKDCRLELYNAMNAFLMTTHCLCPPPTELILAIIQTAYTRDDSLKVRMHCGSILHNIEKIIHPQKESLLFNIEARDIRNAFAIVDEEKLLGEFEFKFRNSVYNNVNEDEYSGENGDMEHNDKADGNNLLIIKSKHIADKNVAAMESLKDQVNGLSEVETNNNAVLPDIKTLAEGTATTNININKSTEFIPHNADEVDVIAVNEEKELEISDSDFGKPTSKKQKLDKETNERKNSNKINSMDCVEDNILAEIVSQFVDELE